VLDGLEELAGVGGQALAQPAASALDGQVLVEAERRRLARMATSLASLCESVASRLGAGLGTGLSPAVPGVTG
jgi:hypothetical protein